MKECWFWIWAPVVQGTRDTIQRQDLSKNHSVRKGGIWRPKNKRKRQQRASCILQGLPSFFFRKHWPPNYIAWKPGKAKEHTDRPLFRFPAISPQGLPDEGTAVRLRCGQLTCFLWSCSLNPLSRPSNSYCIAHSYSWPGKFPLYAQVDLSSVNSHITGNCAEKHFFPPVLKGCVTIWTK